MIYLFPNIDRPDSLKKTILSREMIPFIVHSAERNNLFCCKATYHSGLAIFVYIPL